MKQIGLFNTPTKDYPCIAWWSGGADSAYTCFLCIQYFGKENVRIVGIDTKNEHPDNERFKRDCEKWYGKEIEMIYSKEYESIEDVWDKHSSLNVATGAICSSELKRKVRQQFQMKNNYTYQAFGFDAKEIDRAIGMKNNYSECNPIFPLIYELVKKGSSLKKLQKAGIEPPIAYQEGFHNNNCYQTGCVQGGIGYWQKIRDSKDGRFDWMANKEHELTDLKGEPVTCLKSDTKDYSGLVFLKPHPKYPNIKDLSMFKPKKVESLMDCNGFCNSKIEKSY